MNIAINEIGRAGLSINLREEAAGAVQSFVSLNVIRNYLIPIPPLAEQSRIVTKVDELMALCDQLEAAKLNTYQFLS